MGSSTAPPLRSICNYKGRVKARLESSQSKPSSGAPISDLGPVKSRFGSRQIPSGVPSNSERGPVKFRAGSENFRTGPCQNPPPHKENSGNSRGIFRPGASFFRLKFPFPVFSALLYPKTPTKIPRLEKEPAPASSPVPSISRRVTEKSRESRASRRRRD